MFTYTTTFECEDGHEITINDDVDLTDLNECPWHPSPNPWPNIRLTGQVMFSAASL